LLFLCLFLKGMMGALAPFSYLVYNTFTIQIYINNVGIACSDTRFINLKSFSLKLLKVKTSFEENKNVIRTRFCTIFISSETALKRHVKCTS
jgi:hypothetical protein